MSHPSAIAIFPAVGKVAERRLAALDEIACMTEAMMALAEEGDWDALPEAQAARDAALRACFSAPLTEDDGPRLQRIKSSACSGRMRLWCARSRKPRTSFLKRCSAPSKTTRR